MTNFEAQQIAETIKKQLYATGTQKVWSWGANAFKYGITTETRFPYPYLRFKVQGFKLKGVVRIVYNTGSDEYYIEFFKGRSNEPYKTVEGVHWPDMNEIIDREVETNDDKGVIYAKKVANAKYKL